MQRILEECSYDYQIPLLQTFNFPDYQLCWLFSRDPGSYIYFTHYHSDSLILSQRLVPQMYRNPLGLFIIASASLHFHWLPALPLLSVWLANFLLYLGNGIGGGFIKILSSLLLPGGLKKKKPLSLLLVDQAVQNGIKGRVLIALYF